MIGWNAIDEHVTAALAGLQEGGRAVFAEVRCRPAMDKRALLAGLEHERLPAAWVVADSRGGTGSEPGEPVFAVYLAAGSAREPAESLRGAADCLGTYQLSELAAQALHGLSLGERRVAVLQGEEPAGAGDRLAIWRQEYRVVAGVPLSAPTFVAVALAGTQSEVWTEVGEFRREAVRFSFPGIDGVFEHLVGVRERPITWHGRLRAASHWALNDLEAGLEATVRLAHADTLQDGFGRQFEACVPLGYRRKGARRLDPISGQVVQDFEMSFVQLLG